MKLEEKIRELMKFVILAIHKTKNNGDLLFCNTPWGDEMQNSRTDRERYSSHNNELF